MKTNTQMAKEFKKKEIETNICARLALDYILKDQEGRG